MGCAAVSAVCDQEWRLLRYFVRSAFEEIGATLNLGAATAVAEFDR